MQIERDFTSGKITLAFETGTRVELTQEETREFDERIRRIQKQALLGLNSLHAFLFLGRYLPRSLESDLQQ